MNISDIFEYYVNINLDESPKSPSSPTLWPLMFVALALVLAIVAFGVWKRKPLKKFVNKNIRKYKR